MFSQLSDGLQKIIVSILIFLLVFAIYISSRDTIPVSDSRWAVYIALSVVREGNTDLDEYAEVIDSHDNYAVHIVDDHLLSVFPLGTPLMAVPMMFVADKLSQPLLSLNLHEHMSLIRDKVASNLELLSGSIIAALACVVLYWLGRLYLDRKRSLVLLFIFAFCTSMWSTASRALWQHGPSVLMLLLALYLVLAAKNKPGLIQFASLPLAYAYVIRPTNSISVIFISLYVLIAYRKQFIKYLLWASVIAVPFLISNYAIYDNILAPYYVPQRLELFGSTFGEALAGNLVSPARGLLIYSPILLFAGYGVVLKIKKSQFELLDGLIVCILLLHWLTISSFPHWYGGHSYGPRFFTDMLPYLMYFLIPVVGEIPLPTTIRKIPFAFLFLILVLISFFIHLRGATETSAALWNGAVKNIVDDVDLAPERVWDWSDPQFLRGLRPAKLSVLQQYPYFKLEQNSETDQKLTIFNRGDKELTLDVETPSRIKLTSMDEKEEMLLRGMSTREFAISIDTMGYDEGVYNLGGIYLSGVSSGHNSVKNSPIVVPVTVEIVSKFDGDPAEFSQQYLIPIVMSSEEQPDRFVPPMDLIVNGQEQMTTSNQIQAVFGAGWYDLEQHGNYQWRWATSPAVVYVYSPSPQKVKIASTAGSLFSNQPSSGLGEQGVLEITTNGENIANLSVHTGQSFAAETELQTGWNVIVIELEAGNFIPAEIDPASGDARQLSFSLDKINILTE